MLKLFIDQDFNHDILRGIIARIPDLNFVTAHGIGRGREQDLAHLEWATEQGRIIVTHDINTFTNTVNSLIKGGHETTGLVVVPQLLQIGRAIEDLELLICCVDFDELKSSIRYLPLR